jgi:uncharacterized protein
LTISGLSVLVLLPSRTNSISLPPEDEAVPSEPFYKLNILEIFLYFISSIYILRFIISIFYLANRFQYFQYPDILYVISWFIFAFYLLKIFQDSGLKLNLVIGNNNKISLKIILVLLVIELAFSIGINEITLYNLSFIFPNYVEYYLNDYRLTTIPFVVLAILLAPLIEEFFVRGIRLQKFALKWGIKKAIIVSSFIFAIYHFRHDIISLFVTGLLLSILYFKTRSLLAQILLHFLYNTVATILIIINYFSQSPTERGQFISVQYYQNWMQPLLGQYALLIALSLPVLIYFIYKNFPRNDVIIPYYANEDEISPS